MRLIHGRWFAGYRGGVEGGTGADTDRRMQPGVMSVKRTQRDVGGEDDVAGMGGQRLSDPEQRGVI